MSKILVLSYGELAWGRPSPLFDRQWVRGRLSEKICFGLDGPIPGEFPGLDWVTLAGELDRQVAWHPTEALGPAPSVTVHRGEPTRAPILPAWPELAGIQARWATRALEGAGVLVIPKGWLESIEGQQLLDVWSTEGWLWVPLEEVIERRFSPDVRFVSASESWLRITEREGGLLFANGAEAASAGEMAPAILARALAELDPGLAAQWRLEEQPRSGWYVHQQLVHAIAKALREGRGRVELGGSSLSRFSREGRLIVDPAGTSGRLFRFSSAEARDRYEVLSTLRITVELPATAVSWWEQVSHPGFLRSAQGLSHPGTGWTDRETVLLEGVEVRDLKSYLDLRHLPHKEAALDQLKEAMDLGSQLPPREKAAVQKAPPAPTEPAEPTVSPPLNSPPISVLPVAEMGVPPTLSERMVVLDGGAEPRLRETLTRSSLPEGAGPKEAAETVTALAAFQPRQFRLEVPHRPGRVQVWLDGELVEQGNVRRSTRQGLYTIEGVPVPHGAIVRVDFEPSQE